eukprot:5473888-Amphidinium_carterae.2
MSTITDALHQARLTHTLATFRHKGGMSHSPECLLHNRWSHDSAVAALAPSIHTHPPFHCHSLRTSTVHHHSQLKNLKKQPGSATKSKNHKNSLIKNLINNSKPKTSEKAASLDKKT